MPRSAVALACCLLMATGCGARGDGLPQSDEAVELDPAELTSDVTNPWFPLEPGTRWTYRETTEDGETVEVVVTATSVTREIATASPPGSYATP